MRSSKAQVQRKVHAIPTVEFGARYQLTSFAGLVLFQRLFSELKLKSRLRSCFGRTPGAAFGPAVVVFLLVVHVLLGFRRLRELRFYRHDRYVRRVVGLQQMPDVATLSRTLSGLDDAGIRATRALVGDLVLERLVELDPARVSLDFDGTVQTTTGHAEGTAVGYNRRKKGARSYYPLLCNVAQTGQFLDVLHRSGNVHDSRGALPFMQRCIGRVRAVLPRTAIEARMDSAFFDQVILDELDEAMVTFTVSVPFARFTELKEIIESATEADWRQVDDEWAVLERSWKPTSWIDEYRFVFARQRKPVQQKGPLQLDLFEPRDYEFEYTVLVTNRLTDRAADVLRAHHGRAAQERALGEAKQFAALDVIVARNRRANEIFTIACLLAHNLGRELQMRRCAPVRNDGDKRSTLWPFVTLGNLRDGFLRRAGLLVRPAGRLVLRLAAEPGLAEDFATYQ